MVMDFRFILERSCVAKEVLTKHSSHLETKCQLFLQVMHRWQCRAFKLTLLHYRKVLSYDTHSLWNCINKIASPKSSNYFDIILSDPSSNLQVSLRLLLCLFMRVPVFLAIVLSCFLRVWQYYFQSCDQYPNSKGNRALQKPFLPTLLFSHLTTNFSCTEKRFKD